VDCDRLIEVAVKRSAPGHLRWDVSTLAREVPEALDEVAALLERNFHSGLFLPPDQIDRETERRLEQVIRPTIRLTATPAANVEQTVAADPFRSQR
jgi:hypothetical protein